MKLIPLSLLLSLYGLVTCYKMGALITCLEQNDENPYGFGESKTWGVWNSSECLEFPDLCRIYAEEDPFPGKGDVCDHTDPRTGNVRNACKMAVMYGEAIDDEKTWSWKCVDLSQCTVKGEDGNGTIGCTITQARISCCCQDDYCTADPLFAQYAAYGRPDHWPVDFDALCAIDTGDFSVVWDHPSYECDYGESSSSEEGSSSGGESSSEENGGDARSIFMWQPHDAPSVSSVNGVNIADILLISTYFVVGTMCCGLGVFVGTKWKKSVQKPEMQFNDI